MYDGGRGYYALLPQLNPTPHFSASQSQPASYFSLQRPGSWQFLVMDTGLHDHDPFTVTRDVTYLEPDEEAWHVDKISRFSAAGGRTILVSHHQLFSAFAAIGDPTSRPGDQAAVNPRLWESWEKFRRAGNVAAWFWGHEHNLCVYEPYRGVERGRCIGHAAIPVFVDEIPYNVLSTLSDPPVLVDDPARPGQKLQLGVVDTVYAHGFALLELNDTTRQARVSYFQDSAPGAPMYVETL
jgi:hypothetical protein